MLVFDMDGTLLNNDRNMPSENINYLNKLKKEGYIIAIATGRTVTSACYRLNNANCVNYIISDPGAKIYDLDSKKYIYNKYIPSNIASDLLNLYNDNFRYIDICSDGIYKKFSLFLEENNKVVKTYKNKQELLNEIDKIDHIGMSFKDDKYVIEIYDYINKNFKDLDCIIMQDSFADDKWLEILPKGASKYNSINELANYLNISNGEIMAFGDGLNDIEMIEKCGIGVALANALDEVKSKANYITKKTNEELGVIDFLEEYLND